MIAEDQQGILERLDQTADTQIEFKNSTKSPLNIIDARIKAVPRTMEGPGDEFAVIPMITVVNITNNQVRGFSLEFRKGGERRAYFEASNPAIEPQATYISGKQKRFLTLIADPQSWSVRVGGVLFSDGEVWGTVPPPPPPPPPPVQVQTELVKRLEQAPETAIQFANREGTPLTINSAAIRMVRMEDRISSNRFSSNSQPEEMHLISLTFDVSNNTDRRIAGVVVRLGNGYSANTVFSTGKIEPRASQKLQLPNGYVIFHGSTNGLEATVLGVRFEDGEVWGTAFPGPPPPPPPLPDSDGRLVRKAGGVLMSSATHRVDAVMPPLARAARISGWVVVEVLIDEVGNVISARAVSGHPLLKDAAVDAARQWQFSPTQLSGVAVRVIGPVTFYFEP